jgi:hypothetical protein
MPNCTVCDKPVVIGEDGSWSLHEVPQFYFHKKECMGWLFLSLGKACKEQGIFKEFHITPLYPQIEEEQCR